MSVDAASEARTSRELAASLQHAATRLAWEESRSEAVRTAVRHAVWEAEAAARGGRETVPTSELAAILRRLWDVATTGTRETAAAVAAREAGGDE